MGRYIRPHDRIWTWAVRKFAGEDLSGPMDWDAGSPYHKATADHVYPCGSERGYIRIKKISGRFSFEQAWARAIFELHNIASYEETRKVIRKAYSGRLNKNAFILEMARVEFKAVLKTEKFYQDIWMPWAGQRGFLHYPADWYVGVPGKFEEWIRHFKKGSRYPWKVYSDFYDDHLEEWALADRKGKVPGKK